MDFLPFTRPVIGHLDPVFLGLLDETQDMLRQVFRTQNALTLPVSATGSAGSPGPGSRRSSSPATTTTRRASAPRSGGPS